MKRAIIVGVAVLAAMTQAWAGEDMKKGEPAGFDTKEADIPFLDQNSVFSWQADGQTGLWVQDVRKQWYYAKLFAPCQGLDFAVRVAFRSRSMNRLNRDSELQLSDGTRCQFSTFRKADAPPKEGKHHSSGETSKSKDAAPATK